MSKTGKYASLPCMASEVDPACCDRTLAVLDPPPVAIGIALAAARLPKSYPQPHDIPLDLIVTQGGLSAERMAMS